MPHGVFLFPLAQNKKCTKKFTAFLGISSRVETRGGNRLKKGGKFWTRPAICSFALDISTIGQQFQHFFVTLSAPVLHLSFAFHFAFVCRLEIYEAPSTVFAQRGEYQACRKSFKSLFSYKWWILNCKLKIVNKLSVKCQNKPGQLIRFIFWSNNGKWSETTMKINDPCFISLYLPQGRSPLFMKLFFKINWTASLTEKVYNF